MPASNRVRNRSRGINYNQTSKRYALQYDDSVSKPLQSNFAVYQISLKNPFHGDIDIERHYLKLLLMTSRKNFPQAANIQHITFAKKFLKSHLLPVTPHNTFFCFFCTIIINLENYFLNMYICIFFVCFHFGNKIYKKSKSVLNVY